MPITVELTNNVGEVNAALRAEAARIVRESAERLRTGAEENSAELSGAQEHAIYIVTNESSDYDAAIATAQGLYAHHYGDGHEFPALPEIDAPDDELEALVAVGAAYGASNEFLHQAFLTPAGDAERPTFDAALDVLVES